MSNPTDKGLEPVEPVEDLLIGIHEIAEFLFGDRTKRRGVYYLTQRFRLPVFGLGSKPYARRSELAAWISKQPQ